MRQFNIRKIISLAMAVIILSASFNTTFYAANTKKAVDTNIKTEVITTGEYSNWEGVSSISQFTDNKGYFCFAYAKGKKIIVVKTKNGIIKRKLKLTKKYPLFGAVACDSKGNYYAVTARCNTTDNTKTKTVFITKYDKNGNVVKTIGDNGSSSLASYYNDSFYTKNPFDGGNCDIAINGDLLSVHYARQMYSGHQSNSVLTINTKTMKKVNIGSIYSSHSFGQRVIPYKDGFVYASEGDCYSRAFTIDAALPSTGELYTSDIFHFWVSPGTYSNWDMFTLNDNFAHIGDLANVTSDTVAFVGTSVKSLNSKALKENEQLFIQIFNPTADLTKASSYITKGKRSGLSGPDGTDKVKNYGVKFLTNTKSCLIRYPQLVSNGKNKLIVLYEKYSYKTGKYKGVYYQVLNNSGKVIKKETFYSKDVYLNHCETPIYTNGQVNWISNNEKGNIVICSLKVK